MKRSVSMYMLVLAVGACLPPPASLADELPVRRIPHAGEAAEFYFGPDSKTLIGNAKLPGDEAHGVYTMSIEDGSMVLVNGVGESACSHFMPDGQRLIWTSTRDHLDDMDPGRFSDPNNYPQGAELYSSAPDGSDVQRLTDNRQYDAEVAVSPDGKWLLWARQIDGKIDLWRMPVDGSGAEEQITFTDADQEGGAFYLPDSETIIYRTWDIASQGQRGMPMTIYTMKHDGSDKKQVTTDEGTNWAPYPAPDGKHFVYVKVLQPGYNFEIFLRNLETGEETRLTYSDGFDGFPALSPDGKWMTFSSGRQAPEGQRTLHQYVMDVSSLNLSAQ